MQIGALIVAAGMSSRMGEFKPMLELGEISVAQRVVTNFQQAGVDRIVMITGFNAVALERHLAGNEVIFLRNEQYETTEMFDSIRIGLEYLKDKVDVILLTPVDIPLFSSATVEALLMDDSPLACPVCDGQRGHPIKIASELVDSILAYQGNEGLRGALEQCGVPIKEIPVTDQGILHDMDTPEDYSKLLAIHNEGLSRPVISVSLARELPFFDEQMAMLLELIDETHSVRAACQRMQISYSTGWNIIRILESQLTRTLIEREQGGSHGGKSYLTDYGRKFVRDYREYSEKVKQYAQDLFPRCFSEL